MIYFVENPDNGFIKIGYSVNVPRRLKELRQADHPGLVFMGAMDGRLIDERELHNRFANLREKGEWFRRNPILLEMIEKDATLTLGETTPAKAEAIVSFSLRISSDLLAQISDLAVAELRSTNREMVQALRQHVLARKQKASSK